jgi:hypothetical protein
MKILDRLPISAKHLLIDVHGKPLRLKPYQIVAQVSISNIRTWDARTPTIPVLIDTGMNHNFSIQEAQLTRWAGLHSQALLPMGSMREGGRTPSCYRAHVWIHRNRTGMRDLRDGEPFRLDLDEGIMIYADDGSDYPRLPLLGLRAIIKNKLKLAIDGKRQHASLALPVW